MLLIYSFIEYFNQSELPEHVKYQPKNIQKPLICLSNMRFLGMDSNHRAYLREYRSFSTYVVTLTFSTYYEYNEKIYFEAREIYPVKQKYFSQQSEKTQRGKSLSKFKLNFFLGEKKENISEVFSKLLFEDGIYTRILNEKGTWMIHL